MGKKSQPSGMAEDPEKELERLRLENEGLKRQNRMFAEIIGEAPGPIWRRNEMLDIAFCNPAHKRIVEEAGEVRSASALELGKQARELALRASDSRTPLAKKMHIVVEGQRRLFDIKEVPLDKNRGQIGFAWDVSDQEALQKEIKKYITAQSDLLESSASAMAIFGPDKRLKFYNNAFIRLWKLEESFLETEPDYGELLERLREKRRLPEQANFPAFRREQLAMFQELIDPKEELFYLPGGETLRVVAIPHALGGIMFTYEDITDRLALERSYNTLIAVQRATLDNMHEGVVVFGEHGRIKLSNPVYAKLWNLEMEYLASEPHMSDVTEQTRDLYSGNEDWPAFKEKLIDTITCREFREGRMERTDGKVIDWASVPLPDGATLMSYIDVTDSTLVERSLRERNEALEEADKLKTEFLANVSYELRSPLTSIIGFAEVLTHNYFGDLNERQKEYVEGIYNSSQTLMALINDILDIASIEAGFMRLELELFSIDRMLSSVLPLVQERAKEGELELAYECPDTIGSMEADERRLKQVVFNLLSNAIKFTPEGGKVKLGVASEDDDFILLWVEDTGIGIPEDEQATVFEKFQQTISGRARRSGTGLGLTIVRNFIQMHGGTVTLESEEGKGTKVTCRLPRKTEVTAAKESLV